MGAMLIVMRSLQTKGEVCPVTAIAIFVLALSGDAKLSQIWDGNSSYLANASSNR
jgi:hypothetical protein